MLITFASTYAKELVSLSVPFVAWFLNRQFQPSAKLIKTVSHGFHYIVPEPLRDAEGNVLRPTQTVRTTSVTVINAGRLPAKGVEIVFNWKPQFYNVWPIRAFTELASEDGRFSIVLPDLAPKEDFSVNLLAINLDPPAVVNVRSEQCTAKDVPIVSQVLRPRWKIILAGWLMFSGLIFSIYILLTIIEFAVRR